MTPTAATILLYLGALFLTVATLWPFSPQKIRTETNPGFFWVLIFVVIPFVMLIYFGVAFIISKIISVGAVLPAERKLSLAESLVAVVSYVALSGWLLFRWRNRMVPGTLGLITIATVSMVIFVGVIRVAHHNHII